MKLSSIVTKLWIWISVLTLIVIGIAGIVHTSIMDKMYYGLQTRQLTALAIKVASLDRPEINSQMVNLNVKLVSDLIEGNIMVIGWQWVSFILAHSVAQASQIVAQVAHSWAENSLFLDIYWDALEQISAQSLSTRIHRIRACTSGSFRQAM